MSTLGNTSPSTASTQHCTSTQARWPAGCGSWRRAMPAGDTSALARRIHAETAGNPLFVAAMVSGLEGGGSGTELPTDVRSAVRDEREALADPVRRVTREIVREELAAANPTPAELAKRDGLSAVRGIGVGMPSLSLDGLAREVAAAVGCTYSAAVLALTTEDAR